MSDEITNVRYMVDDVDTAIDLYTTHFGFTVLSNHAPAFADVQRANLRLPLSGPASSAGRPMPDGAKPGPGGWNRIHFVVAELAAEVERLPAAGVRFRNDVVTDAPSRWAMPRRPEHYPTGADDRQHVARRRNSCDTPWSEQHSRRECRPNSPVRLGRLQPQRTEGRGFQA